MTPGAAGLNAWAKGLYHCFALLPPVLTRWPPAYLLQFFRPTTRPIHFLFCMVDHYEPGTGRVDCEAEKRRINELLAKYPLLAAGHADSTGRPPPRTWFFPPHYHRHGNLRKLVSLCEDGYGEIELHLHHGKIRPDTTENLRRTIRLCLRDYSEFGIFGAEDNRRRYAFIHGDWVLNNSLPRRGCCGVDSEIRILHETGCYADLTFPSGHPNSPKQINSIHYANLDRSGRRAFSTGPRARAGAGEQEGLLMIQGPTRPVWMDGRVSLGDSISSVRPPRQKLIDVLVRTGVHVLGRPEWVIVKVHTHGAVESAAVLGRQMDDAFTYLESAYNDGSSYVLHYVTARELYNVVCAAEAGETGDPAAYRNYRVSPPDYDSSPKISEASKELQKAVARTYRG